MSNSVRVPSLVLLLLVPACSSNPADTPPTPLPPNAQGKSCTVQKSDCPQASLDDYATCVVAQCDAKYQMCIGEGYAAGNFGGPCKSWIECGRSCMNCDQACLQKCSDMHFNGECRSCVEGPLAGCVVAAIRDGLCKLPCVTIGKGCSGVQACCNTLDADAKKSCENSLKSITSIPGNPSADLSCDSLLSGYKMSGKCSGVNGQPPLTLPGPKPTTCSKNGGAAATLRFTNNGMKSITTWWVDGTCVEKKYADLAPGKSYDQGTFVGHPWRLRDTATRELLKDLPGAAMAGTSEVSFP